VVENAPAGIMAAKAADLHCIALTTTLSEEHLSEYFTFYSEKADALWTS
jgi:beta-phosphoglucomutase-like phosphatase (HAD superfamily)